MLEGIADFAMIPSTMAALIYNKDRSYILCSIPVWGTLYLFGSDTSIHSWDDLKTKKISRIFIENIFSVFNFIIGFIIVFLFFFYTYSASSLAETSSWRKSSHQGLTELC